MSGFQLGGFVRQSSSVERVVTPTATARFYRLLDRAASARLPADDRRGRPDKGLGARICRGSGGHVRPAAQLADCGSRPMSNSDSCCGRRRAGCRRSTPFWMPGPAVGASGGGASAALFQAGSDQVRGRRRPTEALRRGRATTRRSCTQARAGGGPNARVPMSCGATANRRRVVSTCSFQSGSASSRPSRACSRGRSQSLARSCAPSASRRRVRRQHVARALRRAGRGGDCDARR